MLTELQRKVGIYRIQEWLVRHKKIDASTRMIAYGTGVSLSQAGQVAHGINCASHMKEGRDTLFCITQDPGEICKTCPMITVFRQARGPGCVIRDAAFQNEPPTATLGKSVDMNDYIE